MGLFGLTTIPVLRRVFFSGKHLDAVKSTLRRLCGLAEKPRFLKSETLDGQRVYYRLTPRGAKAIGLPHWRIRPFGPQALYRKLALLWFVHGENQSGRRLLSYRDIEKDFAIKVDPIPGYICYLDTREEKTRLGVIVIDHGAHPNRTVRKATQVVAWFLNKGWFDQVIRDKAFVLTVLTLSHGKQRAIERNLALAIRHSLRSPLTKLAASVGPGQNIELNVEVVEGLSNLLPPEN